jgi:hypothetical protein
MAEGIAMHRVFHSGTARSSDDASGPLAELRSFLRGLQLGERALGDAFAYDWLAASGGARTFATLHPGRTGATIYLYPDALGLPPGRFTRFYRVLDDAGLGMGSKAGPSIGIDLGDDAQVRLFRDGLAELLALVSPAAPPAAT